MSILGIQYYTTTSVELNMDVLLVDCSRQAPECSSARQPLLVLGNGIRCSRLWRGFGEALCECVLLHSVNSWALRWAVSEDLKSLRGA